MKRLIPRIFLALVAMHVARSAFAAAIATNEVVRAARAFVSADAVGASVLKECTVLSATPRGHLWIVRLSPAGHIVMSGSDLVDPIIGFSKNDFVEPDPASPAYAVLETADASVAAGEMQGGTRHARWTKLLDRKGVSLMAAVTPSSEAIVVEPLLLDHFNQWQPYNDYSPVYDACTNDLDSYRGRSPCGCVATAAVQMFHHFKWPARIDKCYFHEHEFTDTNGVVTSFPIRFDGRAPIDWGGVATNYEHSTGGEWVPSPDRPGWAQWKDYTELRGHVAEAVRYPIARLILWCGSMARAAYTPKAASSSYDTIMGAASDWFTVGTWADIDDPLVLDALSSGIPCHVSIGKYDSLGRRTGHQVVIDGWAEDNSTKYAHLNFGWGGSGDGYYNIAEDFDSYTEKRVYVNHCPRTKPQLDPLPKVCGTSLMLNWHFPDFHTNNLTGFWVEKQKVVAGEPKTPEDFIEDFSQSVGIISNEDEDGYIYVGWDPLDENSGNLVLYSEAMARGTYVFDGSETLTAASVLTFRIASFFANWTTYKIQASFNGGEWQTICEPALNLATEGSGGSWYCSNPQWGVERLYLGDHGGETVRFRVEKNWNNAGYWPFEIGYILLDDFKVTQVVRSENSYVLWLPSSVREYLFDDLDAGSSYEFTVTPLFSNTPGEVSEPVSTSIVGQRWMPVAGEETFSRNNLVFSTGDASGVWSYTGTVRDNTSIRDTWDNSITVNLPGPLTVDSTLSFFWKAYCYYDADSYDTFSVMFKCSDGTETTLWSIQNASTKTAAQPVSISLANCAGQTGKIVISYSHSGPNYVDDSYGGTLADARVTNVLVPSVPAPTWQTETLVARGMPEIVSVSPVSEGFYSECGTNTTTFTVVCSNTVVSLEARPSHLSLVNDRDVAVTPLGNGQFTVSVTPSGINETNYRSRMILTLVATDAAGTKCYKDLSLRFAPAEVVTSEVVVTVTTSDGTACSVAIPHSWLEENGLVATGSAAAAYEALLSSDADADHDGLPNWAEFVCGTSPTNASEKLTVSIMMENGRPVVTHSLDDGRIAGGFKTVIKGANNLSTAFSDWPVVTETQTSAYHFFRVEIVPDE